MKQQKVKKQKPERKAIARGGRPPLHECELTKEMKNFALHIAKGLPVEMAKELCNFSDYQAKKYLGLENLQEEIHRLKAIYSDPDDDKRLEKLYNETMAEAFKKQFYQR